MVKTPLEDNSSVDTILQEDFSEMCIDARNTYFYRRPKSMNEARVRVLNCFECLEKEIENPLENKELIMIRFLNMVNAVMDYSAKNWGD